MCYINDGSGEYMKGCRKVFFDLYRLRYACTALALSVLMLGCATEPPKKVENQSATPAVELTAEVRADFDTAMAYIKAEEYEKGIVLLNKVAKAAPNNAIPSINLALVYKKQGKLKPAEDSLKQALAAEPDNPVAHNEYALLYRKTGRFKEALGLYEKILEKHPNFMMVHKNTGILCDLYMKDYMCALKHYVIYSDAMQDDKTVKIWIADLQKRLVK